MSIKPYGSTSGRKHGKPGIEIRPSSKTVDAHCHLLVGQIILGQGLLLLEHEDGNGHLQF